MKQRIIFLTSTLLLFASVRAQDLQFLNSNNSLLFLSPSFAGSNGGQRFQTGIQRQWPDQRINFSTFQAGFDFFIPATKSGLGVSVIYDDYGQGILITRGASLNYAQYIKAGDRVTIIPSLQLSYLERTLDVRSLKFGDIFDPRYQNMWTANEAMPQTYKSNLDMSAGILCQVLKKIYLGGTCFHLNRPDIGLLGTYELPVRWSFYGSYNHIFSERTLLQVQAKYDLQKYSSVLHLALNAVFFKYIVTGVGTDNPKSARVHLGARTDYFVLMGGYNWYVKERNVTTSTTWEISGAVTFRDKENKTKLVAFENW